MSFQNDCVLQQGSLVLVTGANGYVGSHVVNQVLAYGYRVRGTARDAQKSGWLTELFDAKYGKGQFELIQIAELDDVDCLIQAAKGCDGIIHTASPLTMDPNPHNVIPQAVNFTVAALEAAAATPSVKRFVFTSSSATTKTVGPQGPEVQITPESWNDAVLENVWAPPPYGPERIAPSYQASKVLAEREMWKFMAERKPHFVANSVLPDYVIGAPLSVQHQGFANSTVMLLKTLMDNRPGWQITGAQYMVDAGDIGRLHLAALVKPDVVGERVFGFAHPKTWTDWISRLHKLYPGRDLPMPPPNEGRDESTVTARPRAEAMLKWLGQSGWRPMEESLKETTELMVESE